MTDRDRFIAAIRAEPTDDDRRLVFADWLDEYGDSDRDAATAEFIRLSCSACALGRSHKPMPRRVYPWLHKNWTRLVPSFLARAKRVCVVQPADKLPTYPRFVVGAWRGRELALRYGLSRLNATREPYYFLARIRLTFWRGFLIEALHWSMGFDQQPLPLDALAAEQPLAQFPNRFGPTETDA